MPITRHLTIVALIFACIAIFAIEQGRDASYGDIYGAVPAVVGGAFNELLHGHFNLDVARGLSQLITYQFLHGDGQHLLYNMVFLWAFGILVSEVLGQWWALACFLVCGICGGALQVYLNRGSLIPSIGASGSICGLGGVYLGLALRWRMPLAEVWPLAYPIPPTQLGAFAILGFIGDLMLMANQDQRIAYGAHMGGFLSGLLLAAILTTVYPDISDFRRRRRHAV